MTQSENAGGDGGDSFKSIRKWFKNVSGRGSTDKCGRRRRSAGDPGDPNRRSGVRWLRSKMRRLMSFVNKNRGAPTYETMDEDKIDRRGRRSCRDLTGRSAEISSATTTTTQAHQDTAGENTASQKVAKKSTQKRIRKVLVKSCHYMGVGVSQMAPGIGGAIGGQVITPPQYVDFYTARFQQNRYY